MYVLVDRENQLCYASKDKKLISEIIGIHRNTLNNWLKGVEYVEKGEYIIAQKVECEKSGKGTNNLDKNQGYD